MSPDSMKNEFQLRYNNLPSQIFYCPGRINLIGEHIDYNGGKVMPLAISRGTWLAIRKNEDSHFRFQSLNFPETADLEIKDQYFSSGKTWFNYPLGVINEYLKKGKQFSGLDMLFYGDIPIGAGLSSSASIEVLMAETLNQLFSLKESGTAIALTGKAAENLFIGVNCGIMDQFAVANGRKDQAILLDCDTLEFEYFPFKLDKQGLVVVNTNKPRRLAESKYNERFAECRQVLAILQRSLPVTNLCDIHPGQFEQYKESITDPVLLKRARHVISEYARVKDATIALQTDDLLVLGKLMYASHHSLKEDYEVSCIELDTIVEFCKEFNGCYGARMTGAGFGGCAIAIIDRDRFEIFSKELTENYTAKIGYAPDVFLTAAEEGVHLINDQRLN